MTTNNHPAHGPVSLDRLQQISEILTKAAAQSHGGNVGYAMADAVKVIDVAIAAFDAEPVGWIYEDELPENYPYDVMFPYSKVDVVRMFPVFGPTAPSIPAATITPNFARPGSTGATDLLPPAPFPTNYWPGDTGKTTCSQESVSRLSTCNSIGIATGVEYDAVNCTAGSSIPAAVSDFDAWSRGCKIQLLLCHSEFREVSEFTWNEACRAAMLQASNSPVTQDGWIKCSERMPEMMRAVQIKSELGGYATSELSGAYDMFAEFWDVAVTSAPLYTSQSEVVATNDSTCKYCGGTGYFRWKKSAETTPCPCVGCDLTATGVK